MRRLDDSVVRRLKARAKANRRPLEGEVRHLLSVAVENDMEAKRRAFVTLSEQLRKETADRQQTLSETLIREDRDCDHRS